jgi:lysyl endopeptidase
MGLKPVTVSHTGVSNTAVSQTAVSNAVVSNAAKAPRRPASWFALAILAAACPLSTFAAPPETFTLIDVPPDIERIPAKPDRPGPAKRNGGDDGSILRFVETTLPSNVLSPLNVAALLAEDDLAAASNPEKIVRVAVGRDLDITARDGEFVAVEGGRLWLAEIIASEALAVRLHFSDVRLPRGAELAVTVPDAEGDKRQVAWIETADFGGGAWSSMIFGERARIEYFEPTVPSSKPRAAVVPFRIDALQQFYRDPLADSVASRGAGFCNNDVSCHPSWAALSRSVARATFIKGNASYLCSGQLLNSRAGDYTPYWLTANHCINSQAVAATAQFFWRFQNSSCNGVASMAATVPSSTGATLLSSGAATDYSLLMVEGSLPIGLAWAGWTSGPVADGLASASIHHPAGDTKRISFGRKASNATCGGGGHVRASWTDGPTEPGSSGAGLFRADTQQLYGQLHCGSSACGNESSDDYGAFAATYPLIADFLAAGRDDVSENNDSCLQAREVTPNTNYANRIARGGDPDWYRISVPAGRTLTVVATFAHGQGDLDLKLYGSCGSTALSSSASVLNQETVTVMNRSLSAKTYYWNAFLYSDTRNGYAMTVTIQ